MTILPARPVAIGLPDRHSTPRQQQPAPRVIVATRPPRALVSAAGVGSGPPPPRGLPTTTTRALASMVEQTAIPEQMSSHGNAELLSIHMNGWHICELIWCWETPVKPYQSWALPWHITRRDIPRSLAPPASNKFEKQNIGQCRICFFRVRPAHILRLGRQRLFSCVTPRP